MSRTVNEETVNFETAIWSDPERMSGTPCFYGTRVPVQTLFDYLAGGDSLDSFLEDFEGVTREQATAVLRRAGKEFLDERQQRAA